MSYAAAAAKGPKQSPEEVRLSSYYLLHVNGVFCLSIISWLLAARELATTVTSSPIQNFPRTHSSRSLQNITSTKPIPQARAPAPPQVEHTDSPSTASLIDVDTDSVHTVPSNFSSQHIQTDTQSNRLEREAEQYEARAKEEAKGAATEFTKREKAAKKKLSREYEANKDNPVYVANAVAVAALGAGLGFGAYSKYVKGELTWKVAGTWAGVVGVFALGDYYLSQ